MTKIYKIPNVYIVGFLGEFGMGKSMLSVRHGLECANALQRGIVSNMDINYHACIRYCRKYKLDWFAHAGFVKIQKDPLKLLSQENKIIIFDEIGIDLFSRGFAEGNRKALIDRIVRPRHYRNMIFYSAQGKEQIDKQLRERTQLYVWSKSLAPYDYKVQRSNLIYRQTFYFDKKCFEKFDDDFGTSKIVYPYWASGFRFDQSLTGQREKMLFACYDSFDKRENKKRKINYVDGNCLNYRSNPNLSFDPFF